MAIPLIPAALTAAALALPTKATKISKKQRDNLLIGGVAAVGLYLLWKSVSNGDGETAGQTVPVLPPGMEVGDISVNPTLSLQVARSLADTIYYALYGDGNTLVEDEEVAIGALVQANNDADVLLIANAYGLRSGNWPANTQQMNMFNAVQFYFSSSDKMEVNSDWSAKGIAFRLS